MKRDYDTIRDILLYVESLHMEGEPIYCESLDINSEDKIKIYKLCVHCDMLQDAGYIKNIYLQKNEKGQLCGVILSIAELTMKGHDFLDNIRDNNRWTKIKQLFMKESGNLAISIVENIAYELVKRSISIL